MVETYRSNQVVLLICDYKYSEDCAQSVGVLMSVSEPNNGWYAVDTDDGQKHMCPQCHLFIFEEE